MAVTDYRLSTLRLSAHKLGVALFLVLSLLIAGCSDGLPRRYPVSGTVKFSEGAPVRTGIVEFMSEDGKYSATGYIDRSGTFTLTTLKNKDGAVAGNHSVIIKQFIVIEANSDVVHNHGGLVDERYADYKNELISVTVLPQKNFIELEVQEQQLP